MAWLRRRKVGGFRDATGAGPSGEQVKAAMAHLRDFVATRKGVEMYVEPRTTVTPTTIVLIATSGEWTRRRISDRDRASGTAEPRHHGVSRRVGEVHIQAAARGVVGRERETEQAPLAAG